VVGGKGHNIPVWAAAAFEIELIEGDAQGGVRKIAPQRADAVVIDIQHVSHNFSTQARDWARSWDAPWFSVHGGWSMAVRRAAEQGIAWFVDAIQAGGQIATEQGDPSAAEAAEVVDNAWRSAADYEREKTKALERRLRKETARADRATQARDKQRLGAEQRIINEIRRRASGLRAAEIARLGPICSAAACLLRAVRNAQTTIDVALQEVERGRAELHRLIDAEDRGNVDWRS
jgi:hypothetical protein